MRKHSNFIFFFAVVLFLGIFATFLEKAEEHKNDSAVVKEIKELEIKEADGSEVL